MKCFYFLVLLCSWEAFAFQSFMPENDLWIPPYEKWEQKGVSEADFNEVLDWVSEIYTPIFKEKGLNFSILRGWSDGTVNAYAYQAGGTAYIKMFGGLARRSEVTKFGFLAVACHEVGHHLGGAPKYPDGNLWASNEGQSDYFFNVSFANQRNGAHIGCYVRKVIQRGNSNSDVPPQSRR